MGIIMLITNDIRCRNELEFRYLSIYIYMHFQNARSLTGN